jgi:ATP-dependent Clp protease ATP-binding subunit ClpA
MNNSLRHPHPDKILRMTRLAPFFRERLFGQDEPISIVSEAVLNAELGKRTPGKVKAGFLFLGPTGVGKTELTKILTSFLYGEDAKDHLLRFNMAEYADEAIALGRLIGSNSNEQGDLGDGLDQLNKRGGGVILADEIEKAHPKVAKIWLAGIDDAEIGFANGSRKSLENCYVVLTSNLGAAEAIEMQDSGETAVKNVLREKAEKFFGPEMIGRFKWYNGVVVFNPLSSSVQDQVCQSIIRREIEAFDSERGLKIRVTKGAFLEFKDKGFEKALGARPMKGTVKRLMTKAYCELLIESAKHGEPMPDEVIVDRERHYDGMERRKNTITMKKAAEKDRTRSDFAA